MSMLTDRLARLLTPIGWLITWSWLTMGGIDPAAVWAQDQPMAQPMTQPTPQSTSNPWQPPQWRSSAGQNFESEGRPPSRTSAGSRDVCTAQLIALVPGREPIVTGSGAGSGAGLGAGLPDCSAASESLIALSLTDRPTFWFYLPQQAGPGTAELAVLDPAQRPLWVQSVSLSGEAGIVGVTLSQPLTANQLYRWVFATDAAGSTADQFVEGWVQHVTADATLTTQLTAADDRTRLELYRQRRLWHDALTSLIERYRQQPTDPTVQVDWSSLLTSAGLEAIAAAPLLDCCTASEVP